MLKKGVFVKAKITLLTYNARDVFCHKNGNYAIWLIWAINDFCYKYNDRNILSQRVDADTIQWQGQDEGIIKAVNDQIKNRGV